MTTIRIAQGILVLTNFIVLSSCLSDKRQRGWSDLPEVTSLDSLKQTDFVATLENPLAENRNIIYAPAFLYAWDKIKEELKSSVNTDNGNSPEFLLLNQSVSHQNSLTDSEYSVEVEIIDNAIIARAFFNKTLPFETNLQVLDEPISFDQTKVSAFGMYYFDEVLIKFTQILYYKDDDNFILKLIPKDREHEIILVNGLNMYRTLKEALKFTNDMIEKGKQEKANSKLSWKYEFTGEDMFSIPVIGFNIDTHYKGLEGQHFYTNGSKDHSLQVAYQRTGFKLSENGAVVESEAVALVDSAQVEPIITHSKKMIFDKEFLIIVKRTDRTNPYFVMKVANAELLKKN